MECEFRVSPYSSSTAGLIDSILLLTTIEYTCRLLFTSLIFVTILLTLLASWYAMMMQFFEVLLRSTVLGIKRM